MSTKQKKWQQRLHLLKNGRIEKEPSSALDKNQKQQKSQHIKYYKTMKHQLPTLIEVFDLFKVEIDSMHINHINIDLFHVGIIGNNYRNRIDH